MGALEGLSKLGAVLDKAGVLIQSNHYKQGWPEVGNVSPVSDPSLIAGLEAQLDAELAAGQAVWKVVLFTPAERREPESQLAESYVYGRMSKNPAARPFLRIEGWLTHLEDQGVAPSVQAAKDTRIHLLDDEKESFINYTVFDCFGYELTYSGIPYYALATAHATLGTVTEIAALYILLAAGTNVLPQKSRMTEYKLWMRSVLVLWWLVLLLGFATYGCWYVPHLFLKMVFWFPRTQVASQIILCPHR